MLGIYVLHEHKIAIVDRFLPSDMGFEYNMYKNGLIDELSHKAYMRQFEAMEKYIHAPSVLLNLKCSEETCIQRIKDRMAADGDRDSECAVTKDYLQSLSESFNEVVMPWYKKRGTPIIELDWEEYKSIDLILKLIESVCPLIRSSLISKSTETSP